MSQTGECISKPFSHQCGPFASLFGCNCLGETDYDTGTSCWDALVLFKMWHRVRLHPCNSIEASAERQRGEGGMEGSRLDKQLVRGSAASQGERHRLKVPLLVSLCHYHMYAYYPPPFRQAHTRASQTSENWWRRSFVCCTEVSDRRGAERRGAGQREFSFFSCQFSEIRSKSERPCLDLRGERHKRFQSDISNLRRSFSLIWLKVDS